MRINLFYGLLLLLNLNLGLFCFDLKDFFIWFIGKVLPFCLKGVCQWQKARLWILKLYDFFQQVNTQGLVQELLIVRVLSGEQFFYLEKPDKRQKSGLYPLCAGKIKLDRSTSTWIGICVATAIFLKAFTSPKLKSFCPLSKRL